MNDSGFEEDQVQLLADLTSQALLHQPASAGGYGQVLGIRDGGYGQVLWIRDGGYRQVLGWRV